MSNPRTNPVGTIRITTRFTDRCIHCDGYIGAGEKVFWCQGIGVWHIDENGCADACDALAQDDQDDYPARDWGDL